jgi:hypothetical protein
MSIKVLKIMRRIIKKIDPKEFESREDLDKSTMKGEMRKIYKEIHRKLTEGGWSAKDVVAWFNEQDIPMTVGLFRMYLWDLDREHGYKRSTDEYINVEPKKAYKKDSATQITNTSTPTLGKSNVSSRVVNKANDQDVKDGDLSAAEKEKKRLDTIANTYRNNEQTNPLINLLTTKKE